MLPVGKSEFFIPPWCDVGPISRPDSSDLRCLLHRSNRSAELVLFHQIVIQFIVSGLSFGSVFAPVIAEFAQVIFSVSPVGEVHSFLVLDSS